MGTDTIIRIFILITFVFFIQNTANASMFVKADHLVLSNAWGRASTNIERPSAIYLKIENTSKVSDRLIAAYTPTAKRAELHHHSMENGIMKMRKLKHIEIPANRFTLLKPGGHHIMLFELNSILKKGEIFPISLTFENAGQLTVKVQIADVGSQSPKENISKHSH